MFVFRRSIDSTNRLEPLILKQVRKKPPPYLEQIDELLMDFEPDESVGENTHSDDEDTVQKQSSTMSSTQQRLHSVCRKNTNTVITIY